MSKKTKTKKRKSPNDIVDQKIKERGFVPNIMTREIFFTENRKRNRDLDYQYRVNLKSDNMK